MVSNKEKVDSFLDKLMTAFETNGMNAFMNPNASDCDCSDSDDGVGMSQHKFDTIESIMAMSSEQLEEHSTSSTQCSSTVCSAPLMATDSLRTIPHLKRKTPAFNSSQEQWNDSLAINLAKNIQTYELEHPQSKDYQVGTSVDSRGTARIAAHPPVASRSSTSTALTTDPTNTKSRLRPTNTDQFSAHKLTANAETVLDVLISHQNHSSVSKRKYRDLQTKTGSKQTHRNAVPTSCRKKLSNASTARCKSTRIEGLDDYVAHAIYNYIHQCQVHRYYPTFDHIHNIILNAKLRQQDIDKESGSMNEFMHKSTETGHKTNSSSTQPHSVRRLIPNKIRTLVSQLVVQLWKCSQMTPYMKSTKRPSDAFRHFAAGVLFGMRRGMKMADDTIVVPHSRSIEHILQLSTTVPRGTSAHEVHLQAHKGTSTLQRCLGSLENDECRLSVYQPAITIATSLQELLG